MEKNQYDIISDIKTLLDSLKGQVEEIEAKLAELEEVTEEMVEEGALETVAEEIVSEQEKPETEEPIAMETPAEEPVTEPASEPVAEEPVAEPAPEPAEEPIAEPEPELAIEDMPEDLGGSPTDEPIDISIDMDDFSSIGIPSQKSSTPEAEAKPAKTIEEEFAPAVSINDVEQTKAKKTVMDVAREKQAWRTDMPGTPVKNIISAISLGDRALLINTLFKGDPIAFNDAITAFNGMASFEEAEKYINENHSGWNMNSDIVYRLMMAIRRKLK